tara:strand:+ start:3005 stop:3514 length:510 start_codon:yes stop_codon:yes gene_type:complete
MAKEYTPFKMKGSPMQRNFGIGGPGDPTDPDSPDFVTKRPSNKSELPQDYDRPPKKQIKSKDPIGDNIKAFVGGLKSDIEKGIDKFKEGFRVGRPGRKGKELKVVRSLKKTTGDIQKNIDKARSTVGSELKRIKTDIDKKFPKPKGREGYKRVLKNKFNVHSGYKWVKE